MKAIRRLVEEHDRILRVLDALEATAARLSSGADVGRDQLEGLVRFLVRYADACHHAKEEDVLFPAFAAAGLPRDGGPIAVMLAEHEEGRALVRVLDEHGAAAGTDEHARARWVEASRSFVDLLRAHIRKENEILYPVGGRMLDEDADRELLPRYDDHEARALAAGEKAELLELLERLSRAAGL